MNIFITGGTGFIGLSLIKKLAVDHTITVIARHVSVDQKNNKKTRFIEGDSSLPGDWQKLLVDQDIIINLAGAPIFTRWNRQKKQEIYNSRILTTRNIVSHLLNEKGNVKKLISASAVGFYGFRNNEVVDEGSQPGTDFLATVCRDWEHETKKVEQMGIELSLCRFGIVLGKKGGALQQMAANARKLIGGYLGQGNQWVPWIHENDLINVFLFLINNSITGPINCCVPDPVTNKTLTRTIASVLRKPVLVPVIPAFMLRLMLGEFSESLLHGQRAYPQKLVKNNFNFIFTDLHTALTDLLTEK